MIDNYEHYITRNIKAFYKRRLFSPIVYLILSLLAWLILPIHSMLIPETISDNVSFTKIYKDTDRYVRLSFSELNFTATPVKSTVPQKVISIQENMEMSWLLFFSLQKPVKKDSLQSPIYRFQEKS